MPQFLLLSAEHDRRRRIIGDNLIGILITHCVAARLLIPTQHALQHKLQKRSA